MSTDQIIAIYTKHIIPLTLLLTLLTALNQQKLSFSQAEASLDAYHAFNASKAIPAG